MYQNSRKRWGFVFVLPQFLGLLLFSLIPLLGTVYFSFTKWDGISPVKQFVGLDNYSYEFSNPVFLQSLGNTLRYMLFYIPPAIVLALLVALAVKNIAGKTFYRLCFFMPVVTGSVSVGVIWTWLLNGEFGLVNQVLEVFGIQGPMWLSDPKWVLFSIALVSIWWNLGYNMVIFLAGLQNIPRSYYEAAQIDGAGGWHQFIRITLPMVSPTTFFVTIMTVISSFQVFDQAYVMTEGGPMRASYTFVYHIYKNAFIDYRMGNACASAMILFLLILSVTGIQMWVSKRWVNYDL